MLAVPPILWAVTLLVVVLVSPTFGDTLGYALALGALLAFLPVSLSSLDLLPATLELDGDVLVLRHTLGLARRTVRIGAVVEAGKILEARPKAVFWAASQHAQGQGFDDAVAGRYVRVGDGAQTMTVATRERTRFRERWSHTSYRAGPARKAWDITLRRGEMTTLEEHLASLGRLAPR